MNLEELFTIKDTSADEDRFVNSVVVKINHRKSRRVLLLSGVLVLTLILLKTFLPSLPGEAGKVLEASSFTLLDSSFSILRLVLLCPFFVMLANLFSADEL